MYQLKLLPPANEVCEDYVFTRVCLSTGGDLCMAGGACVAGVCACQVAGHAWQGACMARGMHGRGACMAGGCAWQEGHAWQGCAWQGGMHVMHIPAADTTRSGNTVNERVVRIPLECILVYCSLLSMKNDQSQLDFFYKYHSNSTNLIKFMKCI